MVNSITSPISSWINESDSGVVRVLKYIGVGLGLLLLTVLILAAFGKMEAVRLVFTGIGSIIKAIWLWVTGLIGLIFGGIKKIGSFFGPGKAEKQIAAENAQIRAELVSLRQEISLNQSFLNRERNLFERERELFESRIAQQEAQINTIREGITTMEQAGPQEWFNSLSDAEQQQIIDRANQDVEEVTDDEVF